MKYPRYCACETETDPDQIKWIEPPANRLQSPRGARLVTLTPDVQRELESRMPRFELESLARGEDDPAARAIHDVRPGRVWIREGSFRRLDDDDGYYSLESVTLAALRAGLPVVRDKYGDHWLGVYARCFRGCDGVRCTPPDSRLERKLLAQFGPCKKKPRRG